MFTQALVLGLLLGIVAGAASGTVAAPVIGTILGIMAGVTVALPISLVAAAVIAAPVRAGATTQAFQRCLDLTLAVLGVATAALTVGWISLDPLVGPWPAITMLLVVTLGLGVARARLRRLAPTG